MEKGNCRPDPRFYQCTTRQWKRTRIWSEKLNEEKLHKVSFALWKLMEKYVKWKQEHWTFFSFNAIEIEANEYVKCVFDVELTASLLKNQHENLNNSHNYRELVINQLNKNLWLSDWYEFGGVGWRWVMECRIVRFDSEEREHRTQGQHRKWKMANVQCSLLQNRSSDAVDNVQCTVYSGIYIFGCPLPCAYPYGFVSLLHGCPMCSIEGETSKANQDRTAQHILAAVCILYS